MEAQANDPEVLSRRLSKATANSPSSQDIFGRTRSMHVREMLSTKHLDGHGRRMTLPVWTAHPASHDVGTIEQNNNEDIHRSGQQYCDADFRSRSCPPIQSGVRALPRNLEADQFAARTSTAVTPPSTTIVAATGAFDLYAGHSTVSSALLVTRDAVRPRSQSVIKVRTEPDFVRCFNEAHTAAPATPEASTTSQAKNVTEAMHDSGASEDVFLKPLSDACTTTLPFDHPAQDWKLVSIPINADSNGNNPVLDPDVVVEYDNSRLVANTRDLVDAGRTKQLLANIADVIDKARRNGTFGNHCDKIGAVNAFTLGVNAASDVCGSAQSNLPAANHFDTNGCVAGVTDNSGPLGTATETNTFHVSLAQKGPVLTVVCRCHSHDHCASSSGSLMTRIRVFLKDLQSCLLGEGNAPDEKLVPAGVALGKRKTFGQGDDGADAGVGGDADFRTRVTRGKKGRVE
jgi:hypothetical protein